MIITCSYVGQMVAGRIPIDAVVLTPKTPADLYIPDLSGYCPMFFWEEQGVIGFGGSEAVTHMSYRGVIYTAQEYINLIYHSEYHPRNPYIRKYIDSKITKELESALNL